MYLDQLLFYSRLFGKEGDLYFFSLSQLSEQLVDILIKTISPKVFSTLCDKLDMIVIYIPV